MFISGFANTENVFYCFNVVSYTDKEAVKSIISTTDLKGARRTKKTLRGIITLFFKVSLYFSIETEITKKNEMSYC